MTQTAVLASVAETNVLKTKQAKGVVEALMAVACDQIKKNGNLKLAGLLNMKLKKKPASPANKRVSTLSPRSLVFSRPSRLRRQ